MFSGLARGATSSLPNQFHKIDGEFVTLTFDSFVNKQELFVYLGKTNPGFVTCKMANRTLYLNQLDVPNRLDRRFPLLVLDRIRFETREAHAIDLAFGSNKRQDTNVPLDKQSGT